MAGEVVLTLPWPPSVNHYINPVMGRFASRSVLSEAARRYRRDVWGVVMAAGKYHVPGHVSVHLECYPPDRRRRDLDNLPKGILDGIVKAGVIEDDSCIEDLRLQRREVVAGGKVVVTIKPMEAT